MIGDSHYRIGGDRLASGAGRFVADVRVEGMLHAAVLRSRHAHARLVSIDAKRARGVSAGLLHPRNRLPTRRSPRSAAPHHSILKPGCWRASDERGWPRRSIDWTAVSGPSSCCVTTATARRAR